MIIFSRQPRRFVSQKHFEEGLEREMERSQEAQSKGKLVEEWVIAAQQKPSRLVASEAQERARRYWLSRRVSSKP